MFRLLLLGLIGYLVYRYGREILEETSDDVPGAPRRRRGS